jgi:hypothetical protein
VKVALAHWCTIWPSRFSGDGHVRLPGDGHCETRRSGEAGRSRPATGCCARRQQSPERQTMSDRQDLPTGTTVTPFPGGSPCGTSSESTGPRSRTPSA